MSTNLEYRARERQEKRKSGRPAKLNEKKGDTVVEREKKQMRHFLLEEQHENFVAAVTMLARVENERQ